METPQILRGFHFKCQCVAEVAGDRAGLSMEEAGEVYLVVIRKFYPYLALVILEKMF